MTLSNITNIEDFLKIIEECEGDAYLVSKTGSKFDLKSVFVKFINFEEIFKNEYSNEIELKLSSSTDIQKVLNLIMDEKRKTKKLQ